jgi:enterochelin esterase-like enzyme
LREVMPRAEADYRVLPEQKSHAIAGLSMGGAESLLVGLNHPERFAWVGAFSAGGMTTNYVAQFPKLNAKVARQFRLLWIGCGANDGLLKENRPFVAWLEAQDIHPEWVSIPGQHSFRVWRRNFAAFAPLLFKEKE